MIGGEKRGKHLHICPLRGQKMHIFTALPLEQSLNRKKKSKKQKQFEGEQ